MEIRVTTTEERDALLDVARRAFPDEDVAGLVAVLLDDPDNLAELSLGAYGETGLLGHIMFSRVRVSGREGVLLAPLGVVPESQGRAVGSALVEEGLRRAADAGFGYALVLGHPGYYPRFGFEPALPHGIEAPHPIDPPEAWMVAELVPGALDGAQGVVEVAEAFAPEEMWRE